MQSNSSVLALFSPQPAVEPTAPKADHGSDSDFNDFLSNATEQVDKTKKSSPEDSANNNNESEVGKTTKPKIKNNNKLSPDAIVADKIVNALRHKRVLISLDGPNHNVLKIKPPMVFNFQDADYLLESLEVVLKNIIR